MHADRPFTHMDAKAVRRSERVESVPNDESNNEIKTAIPAIPSPSIVWLHSKPKSNNKSMREK